MLNPSVISVAGVGLVLWLDRGSLEQALPWTLLVCAVVVYPTARYALAQPGGHLSRRARTPVHAVCGVCCTGGLMMLWALGSPRGALVLLMCGALGALVSMALNHYWLKLSVGVVLIVFVGCFLLMYSWLGLGALALGAWLSRTHPRAEVAAARALGLGLAWALYAPVLVVWELVGFWWGFVRWLGAQANEAI